MDEKGCWGKGNHTAYQFGIRYNYMSAIEKEKHGAKKKKEKTVLSSQRE